jgi:hypothetical protein
MTYNVSQSLPWTSLNSTCLTSNIQVLTNSCWMRQSILGLVGKGAGYGLNSSGSEYRPIASTVVDFSDSVIGKGFSISSDTTNF